MLASLSSSRTSLMLTIGKIVPPRLTRSRRLLAAARSASIINGRISASALRLIFQAWPAHKMGPSDAGVNVPGGTWYVAGGRCYPNSWNVGFNDELLSYRVGINYKFTGFLGAH